MQEPTVSVIIPCYNSARFIEETVDKLMLQTYANLQVILIDDGSTDNTYDMLCNLSQKYNKVNCIKCTNGGLSAARNKGLAIATGKYIQFLDADDYLHQEKIKEQVSFLEQNPMADLVYADSVFFEHHQPDIFYKNIRLTQKKWMPEISGSGIQVLQHLVKGNLFTVCSPLIRASLIVKNKGFNTAFLALEDHEFWLRCAINGANFQYHKTPLAISYIRVHQNSMSKNLTVMYKYASMIRMCISTTIPQKQLRAINALYNLRMNIAILVKGYAKTPLLYLATVLLNMMMLKNTYYHVSNE
jgi:glycosyltransferase involved in cell wall biosynthesis